jgi:lipid-A-disaccharide synthase
MTPKRFMVIAGEASGDLLAAELIRGIRQKLAVRAGQPSDDLQPLETSLEPQFFGAGGPAMRAAGVEVAVDMTNQAVVGLVEVLKNYSQFRKWFHQLLQLAIKREPHAIICVDFSGFNRRFAHAVRKYCESHKGAFLNWRPKLIQYISPQVWASRPGRAYSMARDLDMLLSIFPFEKDWYARYAPNLRVEYVGHPLVDRYAKKESGVRAQASGTELPLVVLLPGSRTGELARHLPVMRGAIERLRKEADIRWEMVVPNGALAAEARTEFAGVFRGDVKVGGLAEALSRATIAIASTGTVTLECAWFGVPTVAIYKTSWSTYEIGKRIINIGFLAMPNILAGQTIFPELIQHDATPEKIAATALKLLRDPAERDAIRAKLKKVVAGLGPPGAASRAADAVLSLNP